MKSSMQFWDSIQRYNEATFLFQIILGVFIIVSILVSLKRKPYWLPKTALALSDLFTGVVFFIVIDKSAVGYYFAFPLFAMLGVLLIVDSIKNSHDEFRKFDKQAMLFLLLFLVYPIVSLLLGHPYPRQILYMLPCPLVCLNILVYSRYKKQSIVLLTIMTIWALTGIKAVIFNVYEDLILFGFAFWGLYLIRRLIGKGSVKHFFHF